jgi:hypothetical protein
MKSKTPDQYTVRNIPKHLDEELRKKAQETGKSLNTVILRALQRGAGLAHQTCEQSDLDFLIGSWVEDADTDDALAAQRNIDDELWR